MCFLGVFLPLCAFIQIFVSMVLVKLDLWKQTSLVVLFSTGLLCLLAAAHMWVTRDTDFTQICYGQWPGVGSHAAMKSLAYTHV